MSREPEGEVGRCYLQCGRGEPPCPEHFTCRGESTHGASNVCIRRFMPFDRH